METLKNILKYRGLKFWVSYDMHMYMLTLFYILLVDGVFDLMSLLLLLSTYTYGVYGFLVNDYFDMKYDILAGKIRSVQMMSRRFVIAWIVILSITCMVFLIFLKNILFSIVYLISFVLAFYYSAPPVRFKIRGFLGLFVNCLIEKTLMTLAIFCYFNHFGIDTIVFIIASFFLHLTDIYTHQIYDYELDLKTRVKTFVVKIGLEKALTIYYKIICPVTFFIAILLVVVICVGIPQSTVIVVISSLIYGFGSIYIYRGKLHRKEEVVPLYISGVYFLIHNMMPVFLAFLLLIRYSPYAPLFILVLISQYYTIKYKIVKPIFHRVIPHVEVFEHDNTTKNFKTNINLRDEKTRREI